MATILITLNGRSYRLACGAGDEARLRVLADDLSKRIEKLAATVGQPGDERLLVMAALLISDENLELKARVAELETELDAATAPGKSAKTSSRSPDRKSDDVSVQPLPPTKKAAPQKRGAA